LAFSFGALALFFIGFGIGFGGGKNAATISQGLGLSTAAAPPPPWWTPLPAVTPPWLLDPGFDELSHVTLTTLAPSGTWDRCRWDSFGKRLFLGLQKDGLVVIPVPTPGNMVAEAAAPVANTTGANGAVFADAVGFAGDAAGFTGAGGIFGRGIYVLDLIPAVPVVKFVIPVANGVGVDNGVFDRFSGQVIMTLVNGSLVVLNATTGALKRTVNIPGLKITCAPSEPCDPLTYPKTDGAGSVYLNAPHQNMVFRLSTTSFTVTNTYNVLDMGKSLNANAALEGGCNTPTGLAIDNIRVPNRILIGCAGAGNPMLLVIDTTGRFVATVPIGRGNDGVIFDGNNSMVYASSGTVGTLTIIQQNTAPPYDYALREVLFTQVGARTLGADLGSGAGSTPVLFTMSANGKYNPKLPPNADFSGSMFSSNVFLKSDLDVYAYGLTANYAALAPPPPFWQTGATFKPSWLSPPAMGEVNALVLNNKSPNAQWDRLTWDAAGKRLFLGLQADGLVSIAVPSGPGSMNVAAARTINGTQGANGLVIAGSLGFAGDAAGLTGTGGPFGRGIIVLNMASLTVQSVVPVAAGVGVDNGVYDTFTNQVIMTLANGSLAVFDATAGTLKKTVDVGGLVVPCAPDQPCHPLEFPTVDGAGYLYVSAADNNLVFKISTQNFATVATYSTAAYRCVNPKGLDLDRALMHLFIGCASAGNPMMLVLNVANGGAVVTTVPIGRGNDGVVYDASHGLIFASSGTVGTLTVIQQNSATPFYAVREVLFTKVGASTQAVDVAGPFVYTMTTDGRYNPARPPNSDLSGGVFSSNEFLPNNLDVLAYGPVSSLYQG